MGSDLERFGDALADRYRLERELGRGGMATVFLAEDLRHRRSVALKVLHPDLAASLGAARFLREIEIAARLVHPHILSLLESGEAGGLLYYVMPYVPGDSLRARLRREGELPIDVAVHILREVLDALAHAHAQGIVHRDIKPENVLFLGAHVQVADFGIAKALQAAGGGSALTATGLALGTPAYMAPEQATADPQLDHRADIYAAGLLAYEMLTGAPPFTGSDPRQVAAAHLTRPVEPLERVRPTVPPALAAVVMRCLEKRPADRWQSVEAVLRQLDLVSGTASGATVSLRLERELESAAYRLTEDVCRRLERASFDPRLIGDTMQYLDNRAPSDVLLACLPACGLDAEQFAPFLRTTRHRAMAPTMVGFEPDRRRRPRLTLQDHLVLTREWLHAIVVQLRPRMVVLVGFSSGGDFALRLAAAPGGDRPVQLDGCLSLGCNLAVETCFVTRILSRLGAGGEAETLAALRGIGQAAESVDDWINVHDYLVRITRKFRGTFEPLQAFARGIVGPFEAGPLTPFVEWYRDATRQGRRLRCVFEDNALYHGLVRELQLRNLDERILGDRYEEESIVVDPDTSHFSLLEPDRIERHVDALVQRLRQPVIATPG
ncbi:MAG TPA: serine/threonine-protein kinase [Gemmatimonadales bacterium]|nr:serine/threonine-protein kinase [Gemmatimonadales bacterium]